MRIIAYLFRLPANFPTRLLRWFFTQQILFSGLGCLGLGTGLLAWTYLADLGIEATHLVWVVVLTSLPAAFLINALASVFVARRMVVPLGSLIEKTRRMRDVTVDDDGEPATLTFDEPGEWFELESAVNTLGLDLRRKTIRLSREKTELRAIMAAVSEAVLAISSDRRVLFFNPQFSYVFNAPTTAIDGPVNDIFGSSEVLSIYEEALATGVPARREVRVLGYDERRPRDFHVSVAPLRKKHNQEVYGVVGIFHDVTELKATERMRIEFVGNVSHELRTPLTTINGYLQTLVGDFARGNFQQASDFLNIAAGNVTRLKDLVEDLLDLSNLESGKELKPEVVRVGEVTEAVVNQITGAADRVRISYEFDELWADPRRLEQVLRNLIENAVRYVPGGRSIEVSWVEAAGGIKELRVRDDGPGIPVEHHARLFERFYRVDASRSRTGGGTGIGLSLVKHIMLRHGGRVYVRSEAGRGAEFICEFPPPPFGAAVGPGV